jgi:hypothetical protein
MRNLIALGLLIPTIAVAQSAFDGTWKARADSVQVTGKPEVFEISNGMYDCKSCAPPYKIKADGTDQPVAGHAYLDHQAVRVLSPSSIEFTDKQSGKVMNTTSEALSADGSKLIGKFTSNSGEKPVTGSFTEKRVGPAPAGALPISGSWIQDSLSDMTDSGLTETLQSTPNGLKMTTNGQTTDAKFDGKEYPTVGDPGKTMVTLKKISDTQIEETDRRGGKVFDIVLWTIAADGKSINLVDTDPVHGTKTRLIFERQP